MIKRNNFFYNTIFFIALVIFTNVNNAPCQSISLQENDFYKIIVLKNATINLVEKKTGTTDTFSPIFFWTQKFLLIDYWVSDAFINSTGKIDLPSNYVHHNAYLQNNVCGDREGLFYDHKNVHLCLTAKMLQLDNIRANYIAAYGNGNLCVGFINQSPEMLSVQIQLDRDVVLYFERQIYKVRLWKDNLFSGMITIHYAKMKMLMTGESITAFSIHALSNIPQFQDKI